MRDMLSKFTYGQQTVRTVTRDGQPWFAAADVGAVLELGNVRSSVALLDDDERGVHTVDTPSGNQQLTIINEPGLYSLILRSRKPEAKQFKRWVTHEVIPSIRKTGSYVTPKTREERLAEAVLIAQDMFADAQRQLQQQESIVDYHKKFVAEDDDIVTIDNFASQYNSTGPKVRDLLKAKDIATRRVIGKRWSKSKGHMVDEHEWRARQGKPTSEWFVSRPQHNAPRLHNGQVMQTMYLKQYYAEKLAERLGIIEGYQPQLKAVS